jgi:hypothetical protein
MEAHTLEQPIANKECRFYVTGTMQQYLGMSTTEGNKMVCMLPISCILVNSTKHTTVLASTCAFRYHLASTTLQLKTKMLLDFEIRRLQDELATSIVDILSKKDLSAFNRPRIRV